MNEFLKKFDTKRLITGVLLVIILLILVLIDSKILINSILTLIAIGGYFEATKLYKVSKNIVLVFYAIALAFGFLTNEPIYGGLFALVFCAGIFAYRGYEINALTPLIYPLMPILALEQVYANGGIFYLFWIIFVVGLCDSFAYFIGKLIGKTPFSKTSPNKTLEGVIGGIVVSSVFGLFYGLYNESLLDSFIISIFIAIFAVFGDLFESLLKRKAGVKDSGNILPGHGGVLDRIDASMFAAFAMLFLMRIL